MNGDPTRSNNCFLDWFGLKIREMALLIFMAKPGHNHDVFTPWVQPTSL